MRKITSEFRVQHSAFEIHYSVELTKRFAKYITKYQKCCDKDTNSLILNHECRMPNTE
jgi:hypothetical protein